MWSRFLQLAQYLELFPLILLLVKTNFHIHLKWMPLSKRNRAWGPDTEDSQFLRYPAGLLCSSVHSSTIVSRIKKRINTNLCQEPWPSSCKSTIVFSSHLKAFVSGFIATVDISMTMLSIIYDMATSNMERYRRTIDTLNKSFFAMNY